MDVPENPSEAIILPPMIFVTFVENAFKHGVSYKKFSSIEIKLTQREDVVTFICRNTKSDRTEHVGSGIGLENVRRRLDLLYSDNYTLNIENSDETYNVELIIPGL
jgi:sensor histidine kinase YesM